MQSDGGRRTPPSVAARRVQLGRQDFFTSRNFDWSTEFSPLRCHRWTYSRQLSVVAVRFDSKDVSRYKVPIMNDRSSCCKHPAGRANSSTIYVWRLGRPRFLGNACPTLIDQVGEALNSGESFSLGSGVPISLCNWGVAVTVAVHCLTLTTFQAFTGVPLCAHLICKLLVQN
jgi:hypothetical protein